MSASDNPSPMRLSPGGPSTSTSTASPHFSIDLNALPKAHGLGEIVPMTAEAPLQSDRSKNTSAQSSFTSHASRASPPPHHNTATALGRTNSPLMGAAMSPHRGLHGSPRHLSPATSQIFERDVQEDTLDPGLSSAIPHHIQTENHIPAVLEAASTAITDSHLRPQDVEIVTSSAHQSAAVTVGGASPEEVPASAFASHSELGANHEHLDASSTYGNVDPTDLRRLSFISFADIVHAEHAHDGKDSSHLAGTTPGGSFARGHRSPSPMRGHGMADRTNMASSTLGGSHSSNRQSVYGNSAQQGELTIETLQQTLDKTRSGSVSH